MPQQNTCYQKKLWAIQDWNRKVTLEFIKGARCLYTHIERKKDSERGREANLGSTGAEVFAGLYPDEVLNQSMNVYNRYFEI